MFVVDDWRWGVGKIERCDDDEVKWKWWGGRCICFCDE